VALASPQLDLGLVQAHPGMRHLSERRACDAMRLARQAAPEAVRRLIELMQSDDERVAAVACNAILDRAYGKPASAPERSIEEMPFQEILDRLTLQQLQEFVVALERSMQNANLISGPKVRVLGTHHLNQKVSGIKAE
jgi:hypothetical protein